MKAEILSILRETEGYISGQQLCKQFQVSRTAVWKVIEQLKEDAEDNLMRVEDGKITNELLEMTFGNEKYQGETM